jgi:hypothetical protein
MRRALPAHGPTRDGIRASIGPCTTWPMRDQGRITLPGAAFFTSDPEL